MSTLRTRNKSNSLLVELLVDLLCIFLFFFKKNKRAHVGKVGSSLFTVGIVAKG